MNQVPVGGRIAIVFDGQAWFVRHIRCIEHDLTDDEKVYYCDRPIGTQYVTLREAIESLRWRYKTARARRAHLSPRGRR